MAVKCRPMSHSQDPWMFVDFPGIHCFLLNYRDDFTNKSCIVSRCLVNNNMKMFSEILRLYHINGTEISLYVMCMKWNPHSGMTFRCEAVIFTAPTFTAKQRNNRPWKSSNFTHVFSKFHEFHTSRVHQLHFSGTLMHKIWKKFFNIIYSVFLEVIKQWDQCRASYHKIPRKQLDTSHLKYLTG